MVTVDAKDVAIVQVERGPLDDEARIRWAHSKREETPATRFEPVWIVKELAYWCVLHKPQFAYYVVMTMPLLVDVAASSPAPGSRVVRLLYEWEDIVRPHMHLTPAKLSSDVLSGLGAEGEQLRAAIRYARSMRNGRGR